MHLSEVKPFVRFARYMRLDASSSYPVTFACDSRLFYTVDGSSVLTVGGECYRMERGDLMIFTAGTSYQICPGAPQVTYIVLNFDFTFNNSNLTVPVPPKATDEFREGDVIDGEHPPELARPLYLRGMERIFSRLERLEREYSRKYLHHELKSSGILTDILVSALRKDSAGEVAEGAERIEEVTEYIREHAAEKITNETLGELFGFHPNYLSTLVKKYTGLPLHSYLLELRLSLALELLVQSKLSVGEIAERSGFCDIYYFSKYFKEHYGTSPMEYRKRGAGI